MKSRFRAKAVTSRYWVNAAVIIILLGLPVFHIIKFDFSNGVFFVFGEETTWLHTVTIFLAFWAGSYVITLTADYIYGRLFCGWICSWGTLLKALRYTGDKVKRKKLSPIVTEAATFAAALISTIGLLNWFIDLTIIVRPSHPAFIIVLAITVTLAAIAFVMLRYVGLRFCQEFCPIGLYLGVVSQKHMMRIDFEPANCTLGEVCVHDCPMAMDPRLLATDGEINTHSQCVLCFDCISSCNACAAKVPGTKPLTIGISAQPLVEVDLEEVLKQMAIDKKERIKAKRKTPTAMAET
ncbi:MAG TPA: 4Fe-4S binding protein [Candidatus Kapabacteria bacterium]|nr:4Fe-4S binding protein [Candidatus Kapabacteria bacterium]